MIKLIDIIEESNVNNFLKLPYEELLNYCKKNFKKIGAGESRCVYDLNNGYVIKVSTDYNKYFEYAGCEDNKREFRVWNALSKTPFKIFLAKVIKCGQKGEFIVMEKCKTNNFISFEKYFKNYFGMKEDIFFDFCDTPYLKINNFLKDYNIILSEQQLMLCQLFKRFYKLADRKNENWADWQERNDNWGVNSIGNLVLIDYA